MSEPNQKPNWLSELQQKSWEPEILLSGIVLYGMFQAPGLLDDFLAFAKLNLYPNNDLDSVISLLKVAFYWLTGGLMLHLISRGIWVGMVGLSFTFSLGIDKDRLKQTPKFMKAVDRIPPIEEIIINLEKVCSALFSISFFMFMVMIGGYFFMFITILFPIISYVLYIGPQNVTEFGESVLNAYAVFMLSIGVVGLIDFLTLGFLKRFKWLQPFYFPVYRVVSTLTLSRFYRPIYYTLITNFTKWKIGLSLTVFVVVSIFLLDVTSSNSSIPDTEITRISIWDDSQGVSAFSGYYDDQNSDFHSVRAQIQSDIISENTIRLFTVLRIGIEDSIKSHCNYDSLINLDTASRYVDLHCASTFFRVALDDTPLKDLSWVFYYKQKTDQRGLLTYIDITDLPRGKHRIKVEGPEGMYSYIFAEIPFYREISMRGYYATPDKKPDETDSYLKLKPILPK